MKKILVLFETNSESKITQFIGAYTTTNKALKGAEVHSAYSLSSGERSHLEKHGETIGREFNYKLSEIDLNQTSLEGFIYVFKKSKV